MNLKYSLYFMMIGSFIIQFLFMSVIMTNKLENIKFSLGKFYISVIMALLMGLLEVMMNDINMSEFSTIYYLSLFLSLVVMIYIYRNQEYIDDSEYIKEMIEHHSMAILTSNEILEKTKSQRIKNFAENIIRNQEAEIDYMKLLMNNNNT